MRHPDFKWPIVPHEGQVENSLAQQTGAIWPYPLHQKQCTPGQFDSLKCSVAQNLHAVNFLSLGH